MSDSFPLNRDVPDVQTVVIAYRGWLDLRRYSIGQTMSACCIMCAKGYSKVIQKLTSSGQSDDKIHGGKPVCTSNWGFRSSNLLHLVSPCASISFCTITRISRNAGAIIGVLCTTTIVQTRRYAMDAPKRCTRPQLAKVGIALVCKTPLVLQCHQ